METTHDHTSHTMGASVNGYPNSIKTSDDFPEGNIIYFLSTRSGSYQIASDMDLSKVAPSKIPRNTLKLIRRVEELCENARDEVMTKYGKSDDGFLTREIQMNGFFKLRELLEAEESGLPDEVRHMVVRGEDAYSKLVEPWPYPDSPSKAFSVKDDNGWTAMGRSMGTAYMEYLKSEGNVEEQQMEGLQNEDDITKSPSISTPVVASELARSSSGNTPSIVAQPVASLPRNCYRSPDPSLRSHTPSQNHRVAQSHRQACPAPSAETLITAPVWPYGCTNPLVKSTSPYAPNNSEVHNALSLAFRYSQSHEASQDPNFAKRAMHMTFAVTNSRMSGIKLQLVPQKGGSSARSRNDDDNDTERYYESVENQKHDESTCTQHIDLQDAPGEIYSIPDRLSDLRRMVDAMMSKNSRVPSTLGGESEFH